ncbi:MAG TPA: hemolysin family protein [Chlamydiales bacterium]|nr:hemolysin family protein [Chlamydiales bacterium]
MITNILHNVYLPLIFLLGASLLSAFNTSILLLGRYKAKEILTKKRASFFFFSRVIKRFFPKNEWEYLYFTVSITKHILQFLYAASGIFYALTYFYIEKHPFKETLLSLFLIAISLLVISLIFDFILRLLSVTWTRTFLPLFSFLASIYLLIFFPVVGPLVKIIRLAYSLLHKRETPTGPLMKEKIREMIRDSELGPYLDAYEQKLITSVIAFRERVAKEIMVPRIDVISLPAETSLIDAAALFVEEGYSRIPIYRESLDNIVGVLLYKDVLRLFIKQKTSDDNLLSTPIEILAKPVIYAPENKKVSQLLQEFRNKQLHMAIVVDEYGGTEGIVTIEDILEELVGDIEDEYDFDEDQQFWKLPNGNWIVDAKMSIIDIESKLGVHIPPHPEYETIGGYVFHRAGTIPTKGWTIQHDEFELEVLSSNDRSIEKIRITPRVKES